MKDSQIDRKFIFVAGLHRSGTTVFSQIIATHKDISNLDAGIENTEGQFFQNVYPVDSYYGGVGRFAFRKDANLTEKSDLVSDENALKLFNSWKKYWDLDKSYLLEKTPRNIVISRFLQALFPNSFFIFITRHPVAVSLATQKWSKTSVLSLVEHWLFAHKIMMEDVKFLKNYQIIRYEDFVRNPDMILKQISEFLNIENNFEAWNIRKNINEKYFDLWERLKKSAKPNNRRIMKAFRKITNNKFPLYIDYKRELEDIELRFEEEISKFGYSFKF